MGVRVSGNVISGFRAFGIDSVYSPVLVQAEIADNRIDDCGTGGIQVTQAYGVRISDNQIRDVGSESDDIAVGIALMRDSDAARITGNVVSGVGQDTEGLDSCLGIGVGAARSLRIAGNRVSSIAPQEGTPVSGIQIIQGADRVDVADNEVRGPDDGDTGADWAALRVESTSSDVGDALVLLIRGNQFEAAGQAPCVDIAGIPEPSSLTFSDNSCLLQSGAVGVPTAAVLISSVGQLILSSNHVTGGPEVPGILALLGHDRFTAVGNIVMGPIGIDVGAGPQPLASPWDALNKP
jgi:hypothetical protein